MASETALRVVANDIAQCHGHDSADDERSKRCLHRHFCLLGWDASQEIEHLFDLAYCRARHEYDAPDMDNPGKHFYDGSCHGDCGTMDHFPWSWRGHMEFRIFFVYIRTVHRGTVRKCHTWRAAYRLAGVATSDFGVGNRGARCARFHSAHSRFNELDVVLAQRDG